IGVVYNGTQWVTFTPIHRRINFQNPPDNQILECGGADSVAISLIFPLLPVRTAEATGLTLNRLNNGGFIRIVLINNSGAVLTYSLNATYDTGAGTPTIRYVPSSSGAGAPVIDLKAPQSLAAGSSMILVGNLEWYQGLYFR